MLEAPLRLQLGLLLDIGVRLAVLLAACARAGEGPVLDAGAGVGTVGLCAAVRCPGLHVVLDDRHIQHHAGAWTNREERRVARRAFLAQPLDKFDLDALAVELGSAVSEKVRLDAARAAGEGVDPRDPYRARDERYRSGRAPEGRSYHGTVV